MTTITDTRRPSVGRQIIVLAGLLVVVAAIAFVGSTASAPNTDGWYAEVERAPWSPPNAVFGPVWTVLYAAIAVAGFLIWRAGHRPGAVNTATHTLRWYTLQLALNAVWTPVFFAGYPVIRESAWWIALVVILALVVTVAILVRSAARHSRVAAWLLVPYLVWVAYASTLNLAIIVLN